MVQTKNIRISVFGEIDSGKSTLVLQYVQSQFVEEIDHHIQDIYTKRTEIDNEIYQIDILDVLDSDYGFDTRTEEMIADSDAAILVYSVLSERSFNSLIMKGVRVCSLLKHKDIPIILVGTKTDLEDLRQISANEGTQMAQEMGCVGFLECSAKTRYNVDQVFETTVRKVLSQREAEQKLPKEPATNSQEVETNPDQSQQEPSQQSIKPQAREIVLDRSAGPIKTTQNTDRCCIIV
ncbi:hypothetical protein OGAPHI_006385 [Ogataea philodendri]|uniref:Uncharacterized protein n=1 Tax=Ogataea philodendri TaxID=1378263 RepID=A0A9P8NY06_9ASCO|nr:uncharacterized protein OGAPHI_006385 [Ogataea philodendri]KAH3661537.1 hypothetical protein OGAPHI_006385 [Ogataea philodendri]